MNYQRGYTRLTLRSKKVRHRPTAYTTINKGLYISLAYTTVKKRLDISLAYTTVKDKGDRPGLHPGEGLLLVDLLLYKECNRCILRPVGSA